MPRFTRFSALLGGVRRLLTPGVLAAALALPFAIAPDASGQQQLTAEQEAFVEDLLSRMTVEEKAGQMTQLTLEALLSVNRTATREEVLDEGRAREAITGYAIGSVLNTPGVAITRDEWRPLIERLQGMASESRLGIPLIYGIDSVHGANYILGATIFPHNLNLGATFDTEHARIGSYWAAAETRSAGMPWTFAPVGDVMRTPVWSRNFETFGESPLVCAEMSAAAVRGFQQDDLSDPTAVAATAKHFLGYSKPITGRDRTPAIISQAELYETFLPPFEAMIDAGVRTVMVNSGEVNGVPVHASRELLTGMLRDELGFDGVVVTDWEDVLKLKDFHRITATEREATRLAVEAGIDIAMTPYSLSFADTLIELVNDGEISESRLDESVRRILRLKAELGLFDEALPPLEETTELATAAAEAASLQAARESLVLLRNEGEALPLATSARILVTGPGADDVIPLHGSWTYSWQGVEPRLYPDTPTILDELRGRFGAQNVTYLPGTSYDEPRNIERAAAAAGDADAVVLVLAEEPSAEQPGNISNLDLPEAQIELARAVAESGRPVIAVLLQNRPRLITEAEEHFDAVLWAGHPGPFGSRAIAEVLTGRVNPSGRLPFTYPRDPHALLTYDHKHTETWGGASPTGGFDPLFQLGDGLSYTAFEYEELEVTALGRTTSADDAVVRVRVTVTNTGDRRGREPVLLFGADDHASVTPHVKRLRAFDSVTLDPGESETLTFNLTRDDLAFGGPAGGMLFEPGSFTFTVKDLTESVEVE